MKVVEKYILELLLGLVIVYFSFAYLPYAYANITLVVLSVLFIIALIVFNQRFIPFKVFHKKYLLIIIPFLLTLWLFLFSQNSSLVLEHVWHKIPLILAPFIVLSMLKTKEQLKKAAFIFLVFSFVALLVSLYRFLVFNPELIQFESGVPKRTTLIQHPYFGIYQLIALLLLIEFYKESIHRILFYFLFFSFSVGVLLSTSRLSYLLYACILLLYVFRYFSKRNAIILLVVLSGIFAIFISTNEAVQQKFSRTFVYKTSPRLMLWNNSYLVLKNSENPLLGVGIDYYNEGVKDPYWLRGYVEDPDYNHKGLAGYSSHNQYIEFILLNGVIGIFYILLMLYTILKAIKSKDIFIIGLSLIIVAFSFTDTILHRQYGIILYAVLMPIIFSLERKTAKRNYT